MGDYGYLLDIFGDGGFWKLNGVGDLIGFLFLLFKPEIKKNLHEILVID